jgi:PAS domain S-box-containing protein
MKLRKISFKTKLIIFLEIFIIAVNSILAFFIWKEMSFMVREISRQKIMALAKTTAYQIDAAKHETIWTEEDEEKKNYEKLHLVLAEMMEANPETDDIYTLRFSKETNSWSYVVEGFETEDLNGDGIIGEEDVPASVGELFDDSHSPEIFNAFEEPSADKELNCDKWGCFLSGYAPIKDVYGKTVAIAAVDIKAQDVINFEKKTKMTILAILASLFIFFPTVIFLFLHYLTRPVSKIIEGINIFGSNLSNRINVKTGDEFELIANTFNKMASELQGLYQGMEYKVREKTKELRNKVIEIEEKKAKDEALLASIGEGMLATDKNGKIIIANKQIEFILGIPHEEIINKKTSQVYKLFDDRENDLTPDFWPEKIALEHAHKTVEKIWCERQDKKRIPIMITAAPVVFKGKVIGVIIVYRDITKEKEIDKAKSEFVSLASHQLLTPLSNIRWYTELLMEKRTYSKETQASYLSRIEDSGEKMVDLIQTLLNVSRIEMGTFTVETKLLNINGVVFSVLEELQIKIENKKIKVTTEYDKEILQFNADPKLFRIVFQNLLSNAVKYTPENGKIEVRAKKEQDGILFEIHDNGYGIPENQKDNIFTKLFRADNVREVETEGNGLGLYIVKSIIENSGGKIWFESKINKGTSFFIKYPSSGMNNVKGNKKLI